MMVGRYTTGGAHNAILSLLRQITSGESLRQLRSKHRSFNISIIKGFQAILNPKQTWKFNPVIC